MKPKLQAGDLWAHPLAGVDDRFEVTIGERGPSIGVLVEISPLWWAGVQPNVLTIDLEYAGESGHPTVVAWGSSAQDVLQQWTQKTRPSDEAETGSL